MNCIDDCAKECGKVIINMRCGNGSQETTDDITIGDNGNWFINGEDTGVQAQGPAGEKGEQGPVGPMGPTGDLSNMDVLFSGKAGELGKTYKMSGAVTDYLSVIVEVKTNLTGNIILSGYEIIPYPQVTAEQSRYVKVLTSTGAVLSWNFESKDILHITGNNIPSGASDVYITKIYGLK